jgi:hypothetical protein
MSQIALQQLFFLPSRAVSSSKTKKVEHHNEKMRTYIDLSHPALSGDRLRWRNRIVGQFLIQQLFF